ncbi:MAG: V-type ATP synthase subunit F [Thermoproteota archaeon]|jgi:vacuolar-type H+-ATPase subunit F/Vma7
MKVEVLGDEKTVVAFALAGVGGKIVSSKEEVLKVIKDSKDVGVFLVVDKYFPSNYEEDFPILVRIPGRAQ